MKLMERDIRILQALAKWGVLGLGQIDAAFFRRQADQKERMRLMFNRIGREDYWLGAYKRMNMLRRQGLVKVEEDLNLYQAYLLTLPGFRLLTDMLRRPVKSFRSRLPIMFAHHELTVSGVGLLLEEPLGNLVLSHLQLYEISFCGDRTRRRRPPLIPDLWIGDKESPCAIEVELSQKSRQRYADLWAQYRDELPRGGRVLYLTGCPSLRDSLIYQAARVPGLPLFAASLEDFKMTREHCQFRSAKGEIFQIVPETNLVPLWSESGAVNTKEGT